MDWIHLAQDREKWQSLASAVMNLRCAQNAWILFASWETGKFSRKTLLHGVDLVTPKLFRCGPGSVVGIETDYGLDSPGIESIFFNNKFLFLKKHVFNKKQYFRHDYDQFELKPLNNFIFRISNLTDKTCSRAEKLTLSVHSEDK